MTHDILNPLPGLEEHWHRATALRYHAPAYASEFLGQTLLFSRVDWYPVYWGPDPTTFLRDMRMPAPRPAPIFDPNIDAMLDEALKDLL